MSDPNVALKCKIKEIRELKNSKDVQVVVTYTKGRQTWHKVWQIKYPEIPVSMEWLHAELARLNPWPENEVDNLANIREEVGKGFTIKVKPREQDIAEKQSESLARQPFQPDIQQPVATPPGTVLP